MAGRYPRLTSLRSTRVLKVLAQTPELPDSKLRIALREIDLDSENDPYVCISYTWGSPTFGSGKEKYEGAAGLVPVTLCFPGDANSEELEMSIGLNLYEGILEIVNGGHCAIELWADQICISQSDLGERRQQVEMMALIFSQASLVIAWLGVAGDKVSDFVRFWDEIIGAVEVRLASNSGSAQDVVFDPQDRLYCAVTGIRFTPQLLGAFFSFRVQVRWFSRMWVVQETVLCDNVLFLYGRKPITLKGMETFCRWNNRNWKILSSVAKWQSISLQESLPLHQTSLQWVQEGTGFVNSFLTLRYILRSKDWRALVCDVYRPRSSKGEIFALMLSLLTLTRGLEVTDPRDSIYSIYGLASSIAGPSGGSSLQADYEKPVIDVFCSLSRGLIESLEFLDVFSFRVPYDREEALRLPSWSPTWVNHGFNHPMFGLQHPIVARHWESPILALHGQLYDAYPIRTPDLCHVHFEGLQLRLFAARCDTIAARTYVAGPLVKSESLRASHNHQYQDLCRFALESIAAIGNNAYVLSNESGIGTVARSLLRTFRYSSGFLDREQYASVLVDFVKIHVEYLFLHLNTPGKTSSDVFAQDVFHDICSHLERLDGLAGLPKAEELEALVGFRRDYYKRHVNVDSHGTSRLAFRPVTVVGNQMHAYDGARCYFRTTRGTVGDAWDSIRVGDEIWLPCRGRIPVVLRPTERPGEYSLIGEAFVVGGMHGALVKKGIAGPPQQISLI